MIAVVDVDFLLLYLPDLVVELVWTLDFRTAYVMRTARVKNRMVWMTRALLGVPLQDPEEDPLCGAWGILCPHAQQKTEQELG